MGTQLATMCDRIQWRRRMLFAVVACTIAFVSSDAEGEGVLELQGAEAKLPLGWIRDPQDLGQGQGPPVTVMTTSTTFSGTASAATYTYKVVSGGKPTEALRELQGEELMGESIDGSEHESRVPITSLQAHLEAQADQVGKVSRLTAVKVLLSMKGAQGSDEVHSFVEDESLIQVSAGAGWGRRRRGSAWQQNDIVKQKKMEEKKEEQQEKDEEQRKAQGLPPAPVPKPPPKVVVKKAPTEEGPQANGAAPENAMDEAKNKADKAIEMAREKGDKATAKAEEEAREAQKEADDKKAFELAEKRKHELTNKEEQQREKKMKDQTEKSKKKAKEAALKAEVLAKAVAKAKEAADKEQVVEKKKKEALEAKQKEERRVMIEKAKEKAAKATKETAEKKIQELKAKFGEEGTEKKQKEKQLKHKHEQNEKKIEEKTRKKTSELARKTAEEAKNKDGEEKALKARDEKKMKAAMETIKKAEEERKDKSQQEDDEKKKRENALKAAAKRRIDEEKEAKAEKRKAMETSAEMATKKADEQQKKAEEEAKQKLKEEVELKKTREKKEKTAREVTKKKATEIVRKATREHADKIEQEKSTKQFTESQHKEKKKKSFEKVQKILEGLKDYEEQLAKAQKAYEVKNGEFRKVEPVEKKHKTEATNLSKVAKELAMKIKGEEDKKNADVCDLGNNLESLKKKGLLSTNEGECGVTCSLKPSDIGIQAQCKVDKKKPECMKLLYTRMQSLSSALISEFDAFKRCTLEKANSSLQGPSGAQAKNLDTPGVNPDEQWMLGEDNGAGVRKSVSDGVEVGDYIYSLKDFQDVTGAVNVGTAMDLLMKCNRDSNDGRGKHSEELGMSYDPSEAQTYNVAANKAEAEGSNEGAGNPPGDCMTKGVEDTIENIMRPATDNCQVHCSTEGIDYNSFTSHCDGSGKVDCFLQAAETYYRSVSGTYLSWKRQCVDYHSDSV